MIDSNVASQIGLPQTSWWYVLHIAKPDSDGFAMQLFFEMGGYSRIWYRCSSNNAWTSMDSISEQQAISDQTNWDNINKSGAYWMRPNINTINHPFPGNWCVLKVSVPLTGCCYQEAIVYSSCDVKRRIFANGAWSAWA